MKFSFLQVGENKRKNPNHVIMSQIKLKLYFLQYHPAFDFLDFLAQSYQDSSGFVHIPTSNPTRILHDHGRLSTKSRNPTRKSRDIFPDFFGIFRMQSQFFLDILKVFQDLSGLLLKILNLQCPRFFFGFLTMHS